MSNQNIYSWETGKYTFDTPKSNNKYEEELKEFRSLIKNEDSSSSSPMRAHQILHGTIVEKLKEFVLVDVGQKSEGLIAIEEFDESELFVGNVVEVFLDQMEGETGQIVLSRDKARRLRQWEHLVDNCNEGSHVQGLVLRKVKGGLMVDIGMEAFLPGSQISTARIANLDEFIGQKLWFKILKINTERKNIVISRRELLEEERLSKKTELLQNIREGEVRVGVAKNITEFGVFFDLDGIDGLLHITDISWKRIKHPSEVVKLGEKHEVKILHVDYVKGRVALGIRQLHVNPWLAIEEKYPVGTVVEGTIVNLVPYGAFIEIEEGVEGLIHVSEMSHTKTINDPREFVKIGDKVKVIVLGIIQAEGKISFGMKQLEENPWTHVEEKYPVGTQVTVEVKSLLNYGAFVELEPGIEGLIHISDLHWSKKIAHPSEVLTKGDKVNAIVLSIDVQSHKITLGLKQLNEDPWKAMVESTQIGSQITGTVTKITEFGAFVDCGNHIEGLIHVTELHNQPFAKVSDILQKGQTVTARVISIDSANRKLKLSLKEHSDLPDEQTYDEIVVTDTKKRLTKKKSKVKQAEEK